MEKTDTFLINYDPIERSVSFAVHKSTGVIVKIGDGEPLKDYENNDGLFSLEGKYNELFDYIMKNFDGKSEVLIKIDVPQPGYNKRQLEFKRFEKNVEKFNKTSDIKINLAINKIGLAPEQTENSSAIEPRATDDATASKDIIANVTPAVVKPIIKVAVIGKISSGKTELIEGLTEHNTSTYEISSLPCGTVQYSDSKNNIIWYEIAGIDFGKENVAKARESLNNLIETEGVSIALYCLNARTGKIENIERDFIVDVKQKYPNVMVYAVITASVDEGGSRSFADTVSNTTKQTKVFVVLAREMRTNAGFLQPYGLDDITKNVYGV